MKIEDSQWALTEYFGSFSKPDQWSNKQARLIALKEPASGGDKRVWNEF